jgi:hypothetical protein
VRRICTLPLPSMIVSSSSGATPIRESGCGPPPPTSAVDADPGSVPTTCTAPTTSGSGAASRKSPPRSCIVTGVCRWMVAASSSAARSVQRPVLPHVLLSCGPSVGTPMHAASRLGGTRLKPSRRWRSSRSSTTNSTCVASARLVDAMYTRSAELHVA